MSSYARALWEPAHVAFASATWAQRTLLTVAVLLAIALTLGLMRRGWVRRAGRQSDVGTLAAVPELPPVSDPRDVTSVPARYVGANRAGNWLDRVVVHGLGTPSPAFVSVRVAGAQRGVWIERVGAPDLFFEQIEGAFHAQGVAARAFERGGVLVVAWASGDTPLEVGLRIRSVEQAEAVRSAMAELGMTSSGDRT